MPKEKGIRIALVVVIFGIGLTLIAANWGWIMNQKHKEDIRVKGQYAKAS